MNEVQKQNEAKRRYDSGEKLCFSTGIEEELTYGYGALDEFGFWEYPLRYNYLREEHKNIVDAVTYGERYGYRKSSTNEK